MVAYEREQVRHTLFLFVCLVLSLTNSLSLFLSACLSIFASLSLVFSLPLYLRLSLVFSRCLSAPPDPHQVVCITVLVDLGSPTLVLPNKSSTDETETSPCALAMWRAELCRLLLPLASSEISHATEGLVARDEPGVPLPVMRIVAEYAIGPPEGSEQQQETPKMWWQT